MSRFPQSPFDLQLLERDRHARGWTYSQISRHIEMNPGNVRNFFKGINQSPKMALKVASALGYPLSRYVVGHEEQSA